MKLNEFLENIYKCLKMLDLVKTIQEITNNIPSPIIFNIVYDGNVSES